MAVEERNSEIIKFLLDQNGIDVNVKDDVYII